MLEYTPQYISRELIRAGKLSRPITVADFCAGNGSLLRAAKERWPDAQYFANDIDRKVLASVPGVVWNSSDFLDHNFEVSTQFKFPNCYDLIVLNPPFSLEHAHHCRARGKFSNVSCSVAFAFLFTALNYLSEKGELLAVMPTSTLKSERDEEARKYFKKYFIYRMISQPSYDRFPGLDVSTYLVAIRHKQTLCEGSDIFESISEIGKGFTISRGGISVRRVNRRKQSGLHGWIHTTSIKSSKITIRYELPDHRMIKNQSYIPKNSLIIPRVGKIQLGDLVITRRREIISDCLLGVTFDDPALSVQVLHEINKEFNSFKNLYAGTGAPYITHSKVSRYIESLLDGLVTMPESVLTI